MNVTSWNYRGMTSKGFNTLMKDTMKQNNSSFLILLETHTSGEKARSIIRRIGLKGCCVEEASGHWGGIWCLWDTNNWSVTAKRS